jgi:hypothetical protein
MEWIVLLALGAGTVGISGWHVAVRRRSERRDAQAQLAGVRRLADEDVTVFGEQLQRLDRVVGHRVLEEDARVDYKTALDAYESAQRTAEQLTDTEQVSAVTDTLTTGRYALACVQARVEGTPLPAMRTPCFFDPRHGPAATEVVWTTGRLGTRRVPACAQDAARVANRESPEVRKVQEGGSLIPYWEAGAAYEPYRSGYFVAEYARAVRGYNVGGW